MSLSPAFDPVTSLLLGEGHQHLVEHLLKRLDDIVEGRTDIPRVVLLTGEQGTGKSRIVREVYRALQAAQPTPAYWPTLPEDDAATGHGSGVDPLPNRKRLGPDTNAFVWSASALPRFTWWTFDCQRTGGAGLISAVEQAKPELRLHLGPAMWSLAKRRGRLAGMASQAENAIERAREAGQEGAVEALEWLIEKVGGPAIPGLGLVLDWSKKAVDSGRRHGDAKRLAESDVSFGGLAGQSRQTLGEEFAELVRATTHPQQPAVVIIEDAHLMDAGLVEFVKAVSVRVPNQPVLVIASAWPHPKPNPPYDAWRRWAEALGNIEAILVPALDAVSLIALVRRTAPNTSDADATVITAKYANPLALKVFLGLRHVRMAINRRGGALRVADLGLDDFPAAIEKLYEKRAEEWPPHVVTALEYAAGTLPSQWTVGPYLPDAVVTAATSVPLDGCDSTADGLDHAIHHNITVPAAGLHSFREVLIADLMRRRLSPIERDELQTALRTELRRRIAEARGTRYRISNPSGELLHTARWLTELNTNAATVEDAVALMATAEALANDYRFAEAMALLNQHGWAVHLPADHPDTLDFRSNHASWLGHAGQVEDAVTQARGLLTDSIRVLGPDHPQTLTTRNNLAHWLTMSGQIEAAVGHLGELIPDMNRVFGPDHPTTLIARANLVFCLVASKGGKETAAHIHQLIPDLRRVLGADHPIRLHFRQNIVVWMAEAGQYDMAISAFENLLTDEIRVLGPDHPDTLATRSNLAYCIARSGRADEAIAHLGELLTDEIRVLGPDHPDTLTTRNNLAAMLGQEGRVEDAITQLGQLLTDEIRILGPDHSYTAATRAQLEYWQRAK